jgi:hypothetical protein
MWDTLQRLCLELLMSGVCADTCLDFYFSKCTSASEWRSYGRVDRKAKAKVKVQKVFRPIYVF